MSISVAALRMQTTKSKEHENLFNLEGLLFCFLAFSLLGSLLSTALSSEMQSSIISTKGSLTYSLNSMLFVTDSTPEGPIPYKIDENSGHQTGSSYTVTAGEHTIELPSPYTSPISGVTYNFQQWDDGVSDNPRTVYLDQNEILYLHSIHARAHSGEPSPPPPINGMPSDYLAYTGMENGRYPWSAFEDNPAGINCAAAISGASTNVVSSAWDDGTEILPIKGDKMLQQISSNRHAPYVSGVGNRVFISMWLYFPRSFVLGGGGATGSGTQLLELRETGGEGSGGSLRIRPTQYGTQPLDFCWLFGYGYVPSGGQYWEYRIDDDNTSTIRPASNPPTMNAHEFPIGRWFKLEIWIVRSVANGVVKCWITDPQNPNPERQATRILFSIENVRTQYATWTAAQYYSMPKIYPMLQTRYAYSDEWYYYSYNIYGG